MWSRTRQLSCRYDERMKDSHLCRKCDRPTSRLNLSAASVAVHKLELTVLSSHSIADDTIAQVRPQESPGWVLYFVEQRTTEIRCYNTQHWWENGAARSRHKMVPLKRRQPKRDAYFMVRVIWLKSLTLTLKRLYGVRRERRTEDGYAHRYDVTYHAHPYETLSVKFNFTQRN